MRPFPIILAGIGIVSIGAYTAITMNREPVLVYPLSDNQTASQPNTSYQSSHNSSPITYNQSSSQPVTSNTSTPLSVNQPTSNNDLPSSVRIQVPFASQAPLLNWDALHQEACEEASLILVKYFLEGKTITPEKMEEEIQALVSWETDNGYKVDVSVDELKTIAKDVYNLDGRVITDVSIESIKRELASGHPIIIPAAGQTLGNPYFTGDGPPYHMLVIVGYDSKNFITNDVGTRRGEGYNYSYDVLVNAIHDWNGSIDTIQSGRKAMLVLTTQS